MLNEFNLEGLLKDRALEGFLLDGNVYSDSSGVWFCPSESCIYYSYFRQSS